MVGSTPFDINKDGEMFVLVMLGFLWISEEELGIDPTITDGDRRYTSVERDGRVERLYLEDTIKQQRSVAGRATICWSGHVEDMPEQRIVVKDSWEYEERPEECLLLKEATEAGVKNVARYHHQETVRIGGRVDDIRSNVRRGTERYGRPEPTPTTSSAYWINYQLNGVRCLRLEERLEQQQQQPHCDAKEVFEQHPGIYATSQAVVLRVSDEARRVAKELCPPSARYVRCRKEHLRSTLSTRHTHWATWRHQR